MTKRASKPKEWLAEWEHLSEPPSEEWLAAWRSYHSPENAEWRSRIAAYNSEHGPWQGKPDTRINLPRDWNLDSMSLDALWHALNDTRRRR